MPVGVAVPAAVCRWGCARAVLVWKVSLGGIGRSGPYLEPGTMRVHVTNGPRNGFNIGRKVGPCPRNRRRWVLCSVHAFPQAVYAANTNRPRFQLRTRPSY